MPDQDPAVQADNSGAVDQNVSDQAQVNLADPKAQEAIQAAAEAAVKDLRKKVDEFRDNNIKLAKELEGWQTLGMDKEHLAEIVKNLSKNREAKLAAEGKLDELFQMRTEPMRKDFDARLEAANNAINELNAKLQQASQENYDLRISQQVISAAQKNEEVHPQAIETIVDLAKKVWKIEENGTPVPRRPNGTRWISKDGKSDISFEEWVESLKESKPFMFKSPSGLNARGGPGRSNVDALLATKQGVDKLALWRELHPYQTK